MNSSELIVTEKKSILGMIGSKDERQTPFLIPEMHHKRLVKVLGNAEHSSRGRISSKATIRLFGNESYPST